ncbi:hypothetical protein ACFV6F_37460 [Kitasatospora phosalacinea]|uniref:hypothetical protein n=1 Tax=Kitasatospora phosalacinea TaxID=2065 RepID=UPI00364AFF95
MAESLPPRLRTLVREMARREAAAHLLPTPLESMTLVVVLPCPVCGADEAVLRATPGAVPPALATVVSGNPTPLLGFPVVTVHGCEWLSPRSLVAPASLRHRDGLPASFVSRSVAWAQAGSPVRLAAAGTDAAVLEALLADADARESALDDCLHAPGDLPLQITGARRPVVLPCSTRRGGPGSGPPGGRTPGAHLLTPHLSGPLVERAELLYRTELVEAVAVGL